MEKTFKKIVSAVVSTVLGFSMITASQVFAKDGSKGDVQATNSTCLAIVPSKGGSTSLQSMASDGRYIYVAKVNLKGDEDGSEARIYRYDTNGGNCKLITNKNGKEYGNFGHAGDMTAINYKGDTYLLVLEKIGKAALDRKIRDKEVKIGKKANVEKIKDYSSNKYTIVHILKVNNNNYEELQTILVETEIGSIAADFRDANNSSEQKKKLYLRTGKTIYKGSINMNNWNMVLDNSFKLNFDVGGCTTSQGMCHYGSNSCNQLDFVYSFNKNSGDKKKNIIVEYYLDKGTYAVFPINTNSTKVDRFELESCVYIGTTLYCCTDSQKGNYNYDAIYKTSY
ncbi:MAG: hypothetical protein J6X56_02005 [Ruminococcus sp.]|nr:hypothetical protein [Ruminococcus sp.]